MLANCFHSKFFLCMCLCTALHCRCLNKKKKKLSVVANLLNCVKTFNLFLAVVAISVSFSFVFIVIYFICLLFIFQTKSGTKSVSAFTCFGSFKKLFLLLLNFNEIQLRFPIEPARRATAETEKIYK